MSQVPLSWQQPCQQLALTCHPACETLQVVKLSNAPSSSSHFELLLLYKSNCSSKTWLFGLKAFRELMKKRIRLVDEMLCGLVLRDFWPGNCERDGELNVLLVGCRRYL